MGYVILMASFIWHGDGSCYFDSHALLLQCFIYGRWDRYDHRKEGVQYI